ncbi:DsbC family protein [Pseudomonas putida]|jgi:TrbB protein|uniref:Thiol:disulfide interchange protein n=2 Tax=Pseudomonas TaxID=286 RepID=A0A1W6QYL6_PSEPU|nr:MULTISPECIES: DsbC family protein [Pseudomonas]ARO46403.1 Conjugal transfer protein TrbB [Pseudomonas putida]MDD2108080.1 DsbC family protein [Pseudomonas asiatica]RNF92660.1 DsbC family protein [Pseudomonas putida]GLO32912.1 protein disulfide-isomerase [Pseudomonas putida]
MKNRDKIRQYDNTLHIHFGSTGEERSVSLLPLERGLSLKREGKQLLVTSAFGGKLEQVVLESFGTEQLASDAFEALQAAIVSHGLRRRWSSRAKGIVKWGIIPAFAVIFALGLNMFAAKLTGLQAPTEAQYDPGIGTQPPAPVFTPQRTQPLQQPAPDLANIPGLPKPADPKVVREAIKAGVATGKYSVKLSEGAKGTVYIFSDPSCPHCQKFEPELEQLAADHTVEIFPVSVIGGEGSAKPIAQMLCAPVEQRASMWKAIAKGRPVEGPVCEEGLTHVRANDQVFRKLQFLGTPTVINQQGAQTPLTLPNQAAAIAQWLEQTQAQ